MRIYHELTNGVLSGESVNGKTAAMEDVVFSVTCEFHSNEFDYQVARNRSHLCRSSTTDYPQIIEMIEGPSVVTGINHEQNFDDYR
jgi:hypothetical protein